MFSDFIVTANAVSVIGSTREKVRILADFLRSLDDSSLRQVAVFFSGSPFPRFDERVTGVGWATIAESAADAVGKTRDELSEIYPKYADLGDAVGELYSGISRPDLSVAAIADYFDQLASGSSPSQRSAILTSLFRQLDAEGARYVVKILQSETRIGLQEGLVESAVARAFDRNLEAVRRANMFTGDIGMTALLAKRDALESVGMTLFHPIAFMLAQAEEDPEAIFTTLGAGAIADDKYDGIRAQIHTDGVEVRIYSRTLDQITLRFPEVEAAAKALGVPAILDGEIVAFRDRILPFAVLQKRLGRRKVAASLLQDAPVVFFAFDLLFVRGEALLDQPLRARLSALHELLSERGAGVLLLSRQSEVQSAEQIDELFDAARARANEGLVIKQPASAYTPGRRGKTWLKYKKALATLDCVVTAAQYGNGKRRAVLSDLTFGVMRDGEIVNIGKAYSGLTDAEIAELTEVFKAATLERYGPVHRVEPAVVLEIAFDRIQESKRHKAGYALRFPRIVRIRDDKTVAQISTIEEVRRIYEWQLRREGQTAEALPDKEKKP
ncbi:MAG TPA: ATP-dependent DNA ligase [Thermoanaerobaculia bacterium]